MDSCEREPPQPVQPATNVGGIPGFLTTSFDSSDELDSCEKPGLLRAPYLSRLAIIGAPARDSACDRLELAETVPAFRLTLSATERELNETSARSSPLAHIS